MTPEPRRWQIALLVGPCSEDEATTMLEDVFDASGGRLGAVASLGHWHEDDEWAVLAERVSTLAETLRDIEWNGYSFVGVNPCPSCGGEEPRHEKDCVLDQALAGLGADPATQETTDHA